MDSSNPIQTAIAPIPVDLFISKKHPGLTRGEIGFADSSGNIVFKVNRQSSSKTVVLNSAGNPLIFLNHRDVRLSVFFSLLFIFYFFSLLFILFNNITRVFKFRTFCGKKKLKLFN